MRILRCCQEMGIETVAAYSEEDADTLPVQFATESVCIGPAPAAKSYLDQNVLLAAAKAYHCEAIHPGYGFLSENADFAGQCEKNGIVFIGPSSGMIRSMGDKQRARELMKKHGVPVVPGSDGILKDWREAAKTATRVGYPVIVKASAGGGGRGGGGRPRRDEMELRAQQHDRGGEEEVEEVRGFHRVVGSGWFDSESFSSVPVGQTNRQYGRWTKAESAMHSAAIDSTRTGTVRHAKAENSSHSIHCAHPAHSDRSTSAAHRPRRNASRRRTSADGRRDLRAKRRPASSCAAPNGQAQRQ